MPTLHEIQRQFRDALFEYDPSRIEQQIRAGYISTRTGLDIYRNNVHTNLRESLRTLFPVINTLVGDAFFNYATEKFIHDYPSPAGDLNEYGEKFTEFLDRFEPAGELKYLPDTARLEWAIHRVYHAKNNAALDRQRLALIPPAAYGDLHFKLNQACMLVQSMYPVHDIWRVNQPNHTGDACVDLDWGGVSLLVARRDDRIVMDKLTTGETAFLSAIERRSSFSMACTEAMQADAAFSLKNAMTIYVQNGTLIDFDFRQPSKINHNQTKRG